MAANYWDSTQAKHWTFTKPELANLRQQLQDSNQHIYTKYPLPDRRILNIFMQQHLVRLAKRMSLRQQALATAQAYIKRFYLRVEIRKTNPYLIMTTAVYLACKMEECPQHIRLMLGEAARQWPELGVTESGKIGECEFAMISTLNSRLIVHHPYRSLNELAPLLGLTADEQTLAHSIINDSYNTDLLLLYPPHIIALTAIFLAITHRPLTGHSIPQGMPPYNSMASSPTSPTPLQSPGGGPPGIPGYSPTSLSPGTPGTPGTPSMSAATAQSLLVAGMQASMKQLGPKLVKLIDWLAESGVDIAELVDATQELVSLYQVWEEGYSEKGVKEGIGKFMLGMKG